MTFKLLKEHVEEHGLRETARLFGISHQRLGYLLKKGKQAAEFAEIMCKLRVMRGESWGTYGPLVDKQYLKK